MPVTSLTEITLSELYKMFHKSVHSDLDAKIVKTRAEYVVVFENLQMDSSNFGHRSALMIGAQCENKTIDDIRERRLGDVPSRFQYPVHYAKVPWVGDTWAIEL